MKKIFNHLFYRTYWWNIKIIKEKELPVLSAFLFTTGIIGINLMTIVFSVLTFAFKNPRLFPDWGYWALMIMALVSNYFLFIKKKKYKIILSHSENLSKLEKRKLDTFVIIYLFLTFFLFVILINESNNLLFQQGV